MPPDDKPDDDAKPDDKPDDAKPDTKPDDDAKPDTGDDAAKWKALARKHEKEAAAAKSELGKIKDAGKTELERLTDRATAAETKAAETEARAMRLEIAAEKGLTAKQASRLVGTTREDLEADADALLEEFGEKPRPGNRPKENLRGGNEPDDEPDETDPRKLAERVQRR